MSRRQQQLRVEDPVWNESFVLDVPDSTSFMCAEVFHRGLMGPSRSLGLVVVQLSEITAARRDAWYTLYQRVGEQPASGELNLALTLVTTTVSLSPPPLSPALALAQAQAQAPPLPLPPCATATATATETSCCSSRISIDDTPSECTAPRSGSAPAEQRSPAAQAQAQQQDGEAAAGQHEGCRSAQGSPDLSAQKEPGGSGSGRGHRHHPAPLKPVPLPPGAGTARPLSTALSMSPVSPAPALGREASSSSLSLSASAERKPTLSLAAASPRKASFRAPDKPYVKRNWGYSVADSVFVVGHGDLASEYEEQTAHIHRVLDPTQLVYTGGILDAHPFLGPDDLPPFCLPRGLRLYKAEAAPKPTIFSFCLTAVTGTRSYVFCLVFYEQVEARAAADLYARYSQLSGAQHEAPQGLCASKCLCAISCVPLFTFFRDWLTGVYNVLITGPAPSLPLEVYVSFLTKSVPVPVAGGPPLRVRMDGIPLPKIALPCTNDVPLLDVPLYPLFGLIGIENVLRFVACLLLEEKVLVVSSDLTVLGLVCEGLSALIHPFAWPHVYVPVLPALLVDFVYSPMPFVIGMHKSSLPLLDPPPEDVAVLDLDSNTMTVPRSLPPLMQAERLVLVEDLKKLLQPGHVKLDDIDWRPWKPPTLLEPDDFNWGVRAAFLKFFTSMLRNYRRYIVYVRVFPTPIAIFNKKDFIKSAAPSSAAFFNIFMDTQLFACFLQGRSWPTDNVFDDLMDKCCWTQEVTDLACWLKRPPGTSPRAPVVIGPPHAGPLCPEKKYSGVLRIVDAVVDSVPDFRPKGEIPQPTPYRVEKTGARREPTPDKSATPASGNGDSDSTNDMLVALSKRIVCGEPVEPEHIAKLMDDLRDEDERLHFADALLSSTEKKKGGCCLTDDSYNILGDLTNCALREALMQNDMTTPQRFLEVAETYYRILEGAEDYIMTRVRSAEIWQNHTFWENCVFLQAGNAMRNLYKSIPEAVAEWNAANEERKHKLVEAELEALFRLLCDFGFKMTNLAVSPVTTRRFASKMSVSVSLDAERNDLLLQLTKNMSKLELREDKNEAMLRLEDAQSKVHFTKGEHENWVPIGISNADSLAAPSDEWRSSFAHRLEKDSKPWLETVKVAGHTLKSKSATGAVAVTNKGHYVSRELEGHTQPVLCLAHHAGVVASGSADAEIKLWDVKDGACVASLSDHKGWVNCMDVERGADRLLSGSYDRMVKAWDMKRGEKIRSFRGHQGAISDVLVCERGVLSASYDCTVHLWDYRARRDAAHLVGHSGAVTCLALDPSGDLLATGSRDNNIRLWDLRVGRLAGVLQGHTDWVRRLRFVPPIEASQQCLLVSGGYDCRARVWDVGAQLKTGDTVPSVLEAHTGAVTDLLWDGRVLCTSGTDSQIHLWDLVSNEEVGQLQGHSDEVVTMIPLMQRFVASAGFDARICIWDTKAVEEGRPPCRQTLTGHTDRISALCSPAANVLASASWDKTLRLWEFAHDLRYLAEAKKALDLMMQRVAVLEAQEVERQRAEEAAEARQQRQVTSAHSSWRGLWCCAWVPCGAQRSASAAQTSV
eukprot:m51a1_g8066 hypothetical protein (1561) ;mRNA; r:150376-157431